MNPSSVSPPDRSGFQGRLFLVSFPKSGNTWVRLLLSNYLQNANEPVSINHIGFFRIIADMTLFERVVGYASEYLTSTEILDLRREIHGSLDLLDADGQLFKVHDAFFPKHSRRAMFPPGCAKIVYIVRNPLDVCVSLKEHFNLQSFDHSVALMAGEKVKLTGVTSAQLPQYLGDWSSHVRDWIDAPGFERHLLRYEDLLAQSETAFASLIAFMDMKDEPERLARAMEFSRFENLQAQEREVGFRERLAQGSRFFRKGGTGDWRNHLSATQVDGLIETHGSMMQRLGYLDENARPCY